MSQTHNYGTIKYIYPMQTRLLVTQHATEVDTKEAKPSLSCGMHDLSMHIEVAVSPLGNALSSFTTT